MSEIIRCLTRSIKILGLIAFVSWSLSRWTSAQTNAPLDDPLFGIEFNPTQVHFELAPARVGQACGELRNRVLWIFARTVSDGKEYLVLNGYFPTAESTSKVSESDFGIGVILDGTSCKVMTSEKLMSGVVPSKEGDNTEQTLPAALDALSVDALNRMETAFRDKDKFKLELSRAVAAHDAYQATLPSSLRSDYPPPLRKHINDFLKEP